WCGTELDAQDFNAAGFRARSSARDRWPVDVGAGVRPRRGDRDAASRRDHRAGHREGAPDGPLPAGGLVSYIAPQTTILEETSMADLTSAIVVKPLALHIGAEISGVDLSRPLDVATRKAINDAFLRWKVVFFRGQHLDHRGHVAFARQMGEPTIGHAVF